MSTPSTTETLFGQLDRMGHEQVMHFNDPHTGLRGIIALHDTTLGPALGGTRIWRYTDEAAALRDVLRLSRGMTYKSAITGIELGGGKAVIIDHDGAQHETEAFWRSYGRFVNNLGGKYITAEDVGTKPLYMEYIAKETRFVTGKPAWLGGGGDPSPVTAYGVYLGMKAAWKHRTGREDLGGVRVMVQGAGNVGRYLIDHLSDENAHVLVADIDADNLRRATADHDVTIVDPDGVYDADVDIYAPCALGATLNDDTIPRLKCSVVAGAANNQLAVESVHGSALRDRDIVYAPDFLINAGGVVNCFAEVHGYDRDRAMAGTEAIYDRTLEVLVRARDTDANPQDVAGRIAEERIEAVARLKARL